MTVRVRVKLASHDIRCMHSRCGKDGRFRVDRDDCGPWGYYCADDLAAELHPEDGQVITYTSAAEARLIAQGKELVS